jgi:DNA mismatch repair ATPase MutL
LQPFPVVGADAPVHVKQEMTMKKFLVFLLGTALAGGMAVAQQEETTEDQTSEYGQEVGEWDERDPLSQTETRDPTQSEMDDPTRGETQPEESTTYGQEQEDPTYGQEQQDPTYGQEQQDPTYGQEQQSTTEQDPMYGQEPGMQHGLSDMSAEELQGMTVVTETGEEVGQIDRIGQSQEHQDRVATVDVGGFLGMAEKTIAIPLSELEMSSDGNVQTRMTKEEIESREEFDEQGFTEEGGETTSY